MPCSPRLSSWLLWCCGGPEQVELDAAGKAQRGVVGEFKQRLARIIERNETLPELEKMDRSEFVVDVAGRYGVWCMVYGVHEGSTLNKLMLKVCAECFC